MEEIVYKNIILGIRISSFPKGSTPHTNPQEPIGLLTLKHPKGTYLKAHVHIPIKRTASKVQECFIVRKGKVRVDLYGPGKKFVKYIFLKEGQVYLSMNGGHGFHVIEDCEIWEVKNGPFKKDKVFI